MPPGYKTACGPVQETIRASQNMLCVEGKSVPMKQIYKVTYHPVNKIYIGKDSVGSYRYFGRPDISVVYLI
jgi:hypothetical protein